MTESYGRRTLVALFRRTGQAMVGELIDRLHAAGYPDITGGHHPVLENVDPQGTRLTVLAARAEMSHQALGEVVQTLERRGYVERRPDPTDGRARLVVLTPKGRALATRALREIGRIEREWQARWAVAGHGDVNIKDVLRAGLEGEARRERRSVTPVASP